MDFGEKLSAARKAKGFSQEELAAKIEVSRQAISKWETCSAQPETSNILKLCEVLEISPNELFGYKENTPAPENEPKNKNTKRFLIIVACIILFSAFLLWVEEKHPIYQYYNNKPLPIPITNLDIHIPPEQPDEGFLYVDLIATFETVKSYQTFEFVVSGADSEGKTFIKEFSATKIGPVYNQCSATIKVPLGGEAQLLVTSQEGWNSPRSSSKIIGWIHNLTEDGISFEFYPDNKEY